MGREVLHGAPHCVRCQRQARPEPAELPRQRAGGPRRHLAYVHPRPPGMGGEKPGGEIRGVSFQGLPQLGTRNSANSPSGVVWLYMPARGGLGLGCV